MSRCNDEWMQAAHEYYLRHATSEVGHRSPICSPCLRLLWAVWSADRSSGRKPDGAESEQYGRDFEFIERGIVISDGTHKVITNRGCDSLHSWEMIGSVCRLIPTTRPWRELPIVMLTDGSAPNAAIDRGCSGVFRLVSPPLRSFPPPLHFSYWRSCYGMLSH